MHEVWRPSYLAGLEALNDDRVDEAAKAFGAAIESGADVWEAFYGRAFTSLLRRSDSSAEFSGYDANDIVERRSSLLDSAEHDLRHAAEQCGGGADVTALLGYVCGERADHAGAVDRYLTSYARTVHQSLVQEGLTNSLGCLLAGWEANADGEAEGLCTALADRVEVTPLPGGLSRLILADVIATRAFIRRHIGQESLAAEDLRTVTSLDPTHPRATPAGRQTPVGPTSDAGNVNSEPTFSEVGGLNETGSFAQRVQGIFETYFAGDRGETIRAKLAEFGQPLTRSVLLFGPSGCGKTFLIRSFSGEYHRRHGRVLPVFRLRLNDVLDRYIGESEKRVTELFERAMDAQPSVIFGDEIDSIGMSREDGQDWRIQFTSHFLQEFDRLKESGAAVVFFGCTNRIWSIDHALTRRFDDLIPVELPNERTRAEIFTVCLKRFAGAEYDMESLAKASKGLTPGDIQKIVSNAASEVMMLPEVQVLTQERLLGALSTYRQPMHVREWVRQSLAALRHIGQEEMAADVERMYGAYIGGSSIARGNGDRRWDPIPTSAWREQPGIDLSIMRQMRS